MGFHRRFPLIGILIGMFALINVESVGNRANLPDLPLDMDSLEYLVDGKTKEHLTKLYHDQIGDLCRFRDKIQRPKQKVWLNILVSIVNENGVLFNSLLEPICGINKKVTQYTEALANEKLVDNFDINLHNDIKKIFEFAVQYHVVVEESFLHANQNISMILGQYKEIGCLDEDQLFMLEANMETLKNTIDDNVSFAKGAVNKLKHTMTNFLKLTEKLAKLLHKLQLHIQLKMQNSEQQRKSIMIELKQQVALCLKEISKQDIQIMAKQNIVGIKEEIQCAKNSVDYLFKDIEDAILRREPGNLVASSEVESLPETSNTQNTLPMKPVLPHINLKPINTQNTLPMEPDLRHINLKPINTGKSKLKDSDLPHLNLKPVNTGQSGVRDLIDYFNKYANTATPRQLLNEAKKDVVLMDFLKTDKINITLEEKRLVKSKICQFERSKIPQQTRKKPVADGKKLPKQ